MGRSEDKSKRTRKMKLLATFAVAASAMSNSAWNSLRSNWSNWNFDGEYGMSSARSDLKADSPDEVIMWDELHYMKDNFYGPLFCSSWQWGNSNWENTFCAYMQHYKNFEAAYRRLMTSQTIREKKARDDVVSSTEKNWWEGKLCDLMIANESVMDAYNGNVRASLDGEGALNNFTPAPQGPNPSGWEGFYTRPTLSGTCYVTNN